MNSYENAKFDESDFLKLFSSVLILLKDGMENAIVNDRLEKKLYDYRDDEQYIPIFDNMTFKDNKLNLKPGFEQLYNEKLLEPLDNTSSLIKIDNDTALEILPLYDDSKVILMTRLVTNMYISNNGKVKVKSNLKK